MDPRIEDLAKDPVMGRAIRELGKPLAEHTAGHAPAANGGDYSGPPTSGFRARDVTQDRPSDLVPNYALPSSPSGESMAWHRQACEVVAGVKRNEGPANGAARTTAENVAGWEAAASSPELAKVSAAIAEVYKEARESAGQDRQERQDQQQQVQARDGRGR